MKYAIENNSGQWWTGTCWGVAQAREEYPEERLPKRLPVDNRDESRFGHLYLWDECVMPYDYHYFDSHEAPSNDEVAYVRAVG